MSSTTNDLVDASPDELVAFLRDLGIRRFALVFEPGVGTVRPSHDVLAPIAAFLDRDDRDFLGHEGLFFEVEPSLGVLLGAFVHRTVRGQAAGGVRFWRYGTVEQYLRDGLRLAIGMTRKNALAGLWWGGGKGVVAASGTLDRRDPAVRETIYRAYGRFMTSLRGCYVTAEDVGTVVSDMAHVFAHTRHTTCIPEELGGSGNPSVPTARGVVAGMHTSLRLCGSDGLAGSSVAVQGCGNVARPLIRFLLERDVAAVEAVDIDPHHVAMLRSEIADPRVAVRVVDVDDDSILEAHCDVVSPCATGGILNPETIPRIRARIVCGAANNQLLDSRRDDLALHERGVVYAPDFLVNRMGIVTCADESAGTIPDDPRIERHLGTDWEHSIPNALERVLLDSRETGTPPGQVALEQADLLSMEPHPIFGHRGRAIIDRLVRDGWAESA